MEKVYNANINQNKYIVGILVSHKLIAEQKNIIQETEYYLIMTKR